MVKFKYNFSKSHENIVNFSKQFKKYADLNEKIYMNTKSSKNVWNDQASFSFFDIVINDESTCKSINNNLEKYIGVVSGFNSSLKNIFLNKGIVVEDKEIEFDGECIGSCLDKIHEIDATLKDCISDFNSTLYPSNFEYYYEINSLYRNISVLEKKTNDIGNDLSYFYKEVNTLVDSASEEEKKIDIVLCDKKIVKLDSSIVSLDNIK